MRPTGVLVLVGATLACGGSSTPTPTAPTPPAPVVVANFAGAWAGEYTVTTCAQTGTAATGNWCEQARQRPTLGLGLTVTQTDRTISAVLSPLGSTDKGTVTGTVRDDNHLTLTGEFSTAYPSGSIFTVALSAWDTTLADRTHMLGTFTFTERAVGFDGAMTIDGTIQLLTR